MIADFKLTQHLLNCFTRKAPGRKTMVHPSRDTRGLDSGLSRQASEVHPVEQAIIGASGVTAIWRWFWVLLQGGQNGAGCTVGQCSQLNPLLEVPLCISSPAAKGVRAVELRVQALMA